VLMSLLKKIKPGPGKKKVWKQQKNTEFKLVIFVGKCTELEGER